MSEVLRVPRVAIFLLALLLTNVYCVLAQNSVSVGQPGSPATILDSTKQQDGLRGSVRRVKTQSAKLEYKSGQLVEGPLQLLEVTTYSLTGERVENVSYPIASSPVGKEEYKYDDKGNIVEMTLRGTDGSIVSREAYDYEFDRFGNWTKMITSLVLFEDGQLKREPTEVTYRTLTYYFDGAVADIVNHQPRTMATRVPSATNSKTIDALSLDTSKRVAENVTGPPANLLSKDAPPPAPAAAPIKKSEIVTTSFATTPLTKEPSSVKPDAASSNPAGETVADSATTAAAAAANSAAPVSLSKGKLALQFYEDGRQHFDAGEYAAAVVAYQQSLQIEPSSSEVNVSLGHAFYKLKKTEPSVKAFKQAIDLNADNAEAHYGLGLNYFGMKRYRDAATAFRRATELKADMAKAHYGLALAYEEMGKEAEVLQEYRALQTLDRSLAQKLAASFPDLNLPCRTAPFCK